MPRPTRSFAIPAILTGAVLLAVIAPVPAVGDGAAADDNFVTGIEDLPLMEGLAEDAAAGMVFDTPAGRIVEAVAGGAVSRDQVLRFYTDTLPQLGWRQTGPGAFRREGEALTLEFPGPGGAAAGAGSITVRFALTPAGGDARGE